MGQTNNKNAPTFIQNDVVILKEEFKNYSKTYIGIINQKLIIDKCYFSDLGDMVAELIHVTGHSSVRNPYLALHFKKIENESTT